MPVTEKQKQCVYRYKKNNIKRVPLDMQKSEYETLSSAAVSAGVGVNTYIKQAIAEKIEREAITHE